MGIVKGLCPFFFFIKIKMQILDEFINQRVETESALNRLLYIQERALYYAKTKNDVDKVNAAEERINFIKTIGKYFGTCDKRLLEQKKRIEKLEREIVFLKGLTSYPVPSSFKTNEDKEMHRINTVLDYKKDRYHECTPWYVYAIENPYEVSPATLLLAKQVSIQERGY